MFLPFLVSSGNCDVKAIYCVCFSSSFYVYLVDARSKNIALGYHTDIC